MTLHWFPGHMTRAKREMQAKLTMVDMVIECRDSRIPLSSQNPLLVELAQDKPKLIILTKRDMSDPKVTEQWVKHLSNEHTLVISLDLLKEDTRSLVVQACLQVMKPKFDRWKARGILPRKIKAMVVGIPNVGKSTLINQLAKKKLMTTADRPGVTMALKWANVHPQLDVLDTPGVLWPKFEDQQVAFNLAISGSIAEKVLPTDELAFRVFDLVYKQYALLIQKTYGHCEANPNDFFQALGKQRHLVKGDEIRLEEVYALFLRDVKHGNLGPMSFEYVEDLA